MSNYNFQTPFCDLAGSIFLTLPLGLDIQSLSSILLQNKNAIIDQPNKIKVIFDNYELKDVESLFINSFSDCKISPYNTSFFKLHKSQAQTLLTQNPQLDWSTYHDNFDICHYTTDQKDVLLNLLTNSFAVVFGRDQDGKSVVTTNPIKQKYILDNFDKHSSNPNLHTFVIYTKAGEVVGTFGLTVVGNEVQLSAVAGRFVDNANNKGYKTTKKLPLISAAFVEVFLNYKIFEESGTLTFSNSKPSVVEFYSQLGFETNRDRRGFILTLPTNNQSPII